ncbi:MAG: hypothetical protein IJ230_02160 [Clostridia bacterium]|nr:hypothetical protein [Clostridia bacterium]
MAQKVLLFTDEMIRRLVLLLRIERELEKTLWKKEQKQELLQKKHSE